MVNVFKSISGFSQTILRFSSYFSTKLNLIKILDNLTIAFTVKKETIKETLIGFMLISLLHYFNLC